jgi:catechol 1,2-dioxygenase
MDTANGILPVNGDDNQPSSQPAHNYDPNFTQNVINAIGPKATPRMRKVMASMIQHIHDFARENEITVDEWMAGVELVRPHPSSPPSHHPHLHKH